MAEVGRITGTTPEGLVEVTLAQPIVGQGGTSIKKLNITQDQLASLDVVDNSIVGNLGDPTQFSSQLPEADITVEYDPIAQAFQDAENEILATRMQQDNDDEYKTSIWERLAYGFDKGTSDLENAGLLLEAMHPVLTLSNKIKDPEYMAMDFDQRRQLLLQEREQQIAAENAAVINAGETGSVAQTVGEFIGMASSPTTLIPAVRILKSAYLGLAGLGAVLGAEYETLNQLANTGEVDAKEVGKVAALSAVATPALAVTLKGVAKGVRKALPQRTSPEVQQANIQVDAINESLARAQMQGVPKEEIPQFIRDDLNLVEGDILRIAQTAERQIKPPTPEEAKLIVEARDVINDPVTARVKYPWWDKGLSNISYDIMRVNPTLGLKLRDLERKVHKESSEYLSRLEPWFEQLSKLPKTVANDLNLALRLGDMDRVSNILAKHSDMPLILRNRATDVLSDIYKRLKGAGYNVGKIENYYPAKVKDLEGLRLSLTGKQQGMIQNAIAKRAAQLKVSPNNVPEEDVATIINAIASGRTKFDFSGTSFSFTKGRQEALDTFLTPDQMKYYADPIESLHDYVRQAVSNINKREFFGTAAKNKSATDIDLKDSIGNLINQEIQAGRLTAGQADKVSQILQVRFNNGEVMPASFIQQMRNLGYIGTLADVVSAGKQLADLGVSGWMNGFSHTLASMFGKKQLSAADFGLIDKVAQEYATAEKFAGALTQWFKYSGFSRIDQFGKDVFVNAALRQAQSMAKSVKGTAKFKDRWGATFGDETDQLINDLRTGTISDNVKLYVWNKLSDAQPISLSEMPYAYLAVPNGRIFYQMKSFSIKQLTNVRNEARQDFEKGRYLSGMRKATGLIVTLGVAGATTDEIIDFTLNQNASVDDIPDGVVENLLGMVGMSKYVRDSMTSRGPIEAAINNLTPPIAGVVTSAYYDVQNLLDGTLDEDGIRSLRTLPIVGQTLYNYFGGGLERAKEKEWEERFD